MSAPDSEGTVASAPLGQMPLRQYRLRQILLAIVSAVVIVLLLSLLKGAWINVAMEVVALGLLAWAYRLNTLARTPQASALMLTTLMAMLCALMVTGEGLFDEAILAFPGLLVFASMFGSRRLFLGLLLLILTWLASLYALDQFLWVRSLPDSLGIGRVVILGAILLVTGFFVWLLSGDLRKALAQLESEKAALLHSHRQIETLAHRDTLTSLPNRALAKDRLDHMLVLARRNQTMVAVMFLDLDNFKTVNDSLGHAAGDELLCMVADRLQACMRESDTVARLAGDEFLLLMGELGDEEAVTVAADKVMQQLGEPFSINRLDVVATASLGIALYPRDGQDRDVLLKNADLAMYRAKDAGRNAFRFFDPTMNASVVEHLHLASGLRAALGNGELRVHYQPQFDLRSGAVIGAEALLRWKHPTLGFIPPAKFVPVAERTGLINDIGAWVLERACHDLLDWREKGLTELVVAINVSPIQFRRDDIEREVANALASCQLPGRLLELELTESLLVADAQHVSEVLQRLRTLGVKFAIDDFGTGYSNLGYLQRFAVHRLKIDQSFVRKMVDSPHDEGIVRAIIEMAHCLGLEVVAEGVETSDMLERLRNFGCEFGQGFLWSAALPSAEFADWVARQRAAQ